MARPVHGEGPGGSCNLAASSNEPKRRCRIPEGVVLRLGRLALAVTLSGAGHAAPAQFQVWGSAGPPLPPVPAGWVEEASQPECLLPLAPTGEEQRRGLVLFARDPLSERCFKSWPGPIGNSRRFRPVTAARRRTRPRCASGADKSRKRFWACGRTLIRPPSALQQAGHRRWNCLGPSRQPRKSTSARNCFRPRVSRTDSSPGGSRPGTARERAAWALLSVTAAGNRCASPCRPKAATAPSPSWSGRATARRR